jgi:hypothetical protein
LNYQICKTDEITGIKIANESIKVAAGSTMLAEILCKKVILFDIDFMLGLQLLSNPPDSSASRLLNRDLTQDNFMRNFTILLTCFTA